ncbi:MAG TPA: hypothetical protein VF627_13000 [Abditibacterium sp.]
MASTAHMTFIGRAPLLAKCRAAVESGQDVWLLGEHGVGKSALARRIHPDALYVPGVTPAKDLLTCLLIELYKRGWWSGPPSKQSEDSRELSSEDIERGTRRLDVKTATACALTALKGRNAILVLDDFDAASPTVVRLCRQLGAHCTLVVCSVESKAGQRPFLFPFVCVEVPRLTRREAAELVARLLSEHALPPREMGRLQTHLIEEAQGLPSVLHELVKRAVKKGDLSLQGVRSEPLHGHKTIDLTPALLVLGCLLLGVRFAVRGMNDADLTVFAGFGVVAFMILRLFAGKLSARRR